MLASRLRLRLGWCQLANFGQVESYLRPLPCLQTMLRADSAEAFALDACRDELARLPQAMQAEMAAVKAARPRGWTLNESECHSRPP